MVYHVSNVHKWNGGKDSKLNKCVHLTLPTEEQHSKKWLRSRTSVDSTLKNVVYYKNLLRDIEMLTSYQYTGALQLFYSLLLKYCLKGRISVTKECKHALITITTPTENRQQPRKICNCSIQNVTVSDNIK